MAGLVIKPAYFELQISTSIWLLISSPSMLATTWLGMLTADCLNGWARVNRLGKRMELSASRHSRNVNWLEKQCDLKAWSWWVLDAVLWSTRRDGTSERLRQCYLDGHVRCMRTELIESMFETSILTGYIIQLSERTSAPNTLQNAYQSHFCSKAKA
ncbi:hypothetical protein BCR34DRAFT_48265 [Clohesyomyces aquaticus]|uniref:Uncharacterized protein n=1 Tax=Clohesyomyces aquaticus TaxID=1231657 RepID=A0A1Y1Z5S1_9PLEO|nr:hypothetical protein BCR34DRAFT_48265 [Clohesyomyces aquaticus]